MIFNTKPTKVTGLEGQGGGGGGDEIILAACGLAYVLFRKPCPLERYLI